MAELKNLLKAKIQYAEGLEEEAAEQYAKGFDEAPKQVAFLSAHLDISSYSYFKEIRDGKLVDRPLLGANAATGDQSTAPVDISPLGDQDKEQVVDSLAIS